MKPYKAKPLPIEYRIDKELLRLTAEANEKYGEYKSLLGTVEFDPGFFLESAILTESYKSTQIEGTSITQDEVYYLKYMEDTDEKREICNLKNAIDFAQEYLKTNSLITADLVNDMHRIVLDSVRGAAKNPGEIRTTQNWIGPRGCTMEYAAFVPPSPEDLTDLLHNLYDYMSDAFEDPLLINIALSHLQFETIHAYKDGNGRLGRTLIPVQMALLDESSPILFLSEVLEIYRPSYQHYLNEARKGNVTGYLKFFLQCVIDQCTAFIARIGQIREIYREDMQTIESIYGNSVYKIMPVIMRQIVFTKKEVCDASGVSENVTSRIIDQLVKLGLIVPDSTVRKKAYRYQRIYEVFAGRQ